jgi:hypothetical protein
MSSRTSLYVRTTPEQHRIAEELLAARGEKSLSKMVIALLLEERDRQAETLSMQR